ncbi:MAG: acyl-CoA dehydrogenase family protein [Rubrivivax sp.]|nr:acyl-CoA dehydrogenase family protein [Rubrivivax sp.]
MKGFATHEVFNQAEPLAGVNLFRINRPLRDALARLVPALPTGRLDALGAEMGSAQMQRHARLANEHAPVLHAHDRVGRRVDVVEFHPSYHALLGAALRHGLHGAPWAVEAAGPVGAAGAAGAAGLGVERSPHAERAAGFMLFTEAEPSVLCPVSMTYAVTPALRANAALQAEWGGKLAGRDYDERFVPGTAKRAVTMGMGMTEKQGGSDVRANTTQAVADGDDAWGRRFRITGHKWFMSAPMCDAFLILAQSPGGLSCFFLPRFLPDGGVNPLHVQRLKHKLGNHANASSEVEFFNAAAWLVGEEGRGVPQILAMGALTRLDCALGTAGLMRQALSIALHHTAQRHAFGKPLVAQPLMKNVLADLALESEAATLLALRLALAVDRTERDPADAHEQVMRRVLTPVAKFWVCKRGSHFGQEAMECLGGNGYVEAAGEGVMARIYREMPLNSIWEGAGNIMALDLQRALRGADVAPAFEHELRAARGASKALDAATARVLAALDAGVPEAQSRILARDTALVLQAALLHRISPPAVFEAFCASRLEASCDVFGALDARADLDAIVERAMPTEAA